MCHQRKSLTTHTVTALPQTPDILLTEGTVGGNGVLLDLFGGLEGFHAALPLA